MDNITNTKLALVLDAGPEKVLRVEDLEKRLAQFSKKDREAVSSWLEEHRVLVHSSEGGVSMKKALYYHEKGRKYRPTRTELAAGDYVCPRCKVVLNKAVYKLRTTLFVCPGCRWSIRRDDIWVPEFDEEPVVRGPGEATNDQLVSDLIDD